MRPHHVSRFVKRYSGRALIATALSSLLLPSARADYQAEVLSENPIVYYRFNDGVTTDDLPPPADNIGSLGAAGDGPYSEATIRQATGALVASTDKAITMAANGVTVPYNAALNNQGSFSVEVWIKPTAIPAAGALICPISSWRENPPEATGREGWLIYQGDAATGFNFRTYNKNGANIAASINSGTGTVAGAWHHVVATWNDSTSVAKIYVNGVLKTTSAAIVPTGTATRAYEANTTGGFTLGSRSDNAFAWSGSLDEPAYYSAVLTDQQVLDHYNNGISASPSQTYQSLVLGHSPVGYWRLNEATFVERTPPVATNAGTLGAAANGGYRLGSKNSPTGPSSGSGFLGFGANNSSVSLATANGYVSTGLSLLNNRTAFTVMGWVKRGAVHSTRGGYFGQNDVLEFGDANNGTQIEAWSAASGQVITPAPYPFADDQWGFITYVADGTKVQMYLNGNLVTSINSVVAGYGASTYNFNIGGGGIFAPTGDYFRGEIDEVAIFDRAVTPGRVKQLYDAALGNTPPGLVEMFPTVSPTGEIAEGQSYTLSIDPTGTPPFTYQWKLGGNPIPGATSRTYTVPAAAANTPPEAAYVYTVTVTNGAGDVTSDPTEVFVTPTLKWSSATSPGTWDIGGASNWKTYTANVTSTYSDDFAVFFDDSSTGTTVALAEDVVPRAVSFNNVTKNYTFTGPWLISGLPGGTLTKNGAGTVTFANDIVNMDNLVVNAGTLRVGDGTTGSLTPISNVKVQGGTFEVNQADGTTYDSPTTVTSGLMSFTGTGNIATSASAIISGPGNQVFNRNGTVLLNGPNTIGGTITVQSGTLAFDGNQQANRLAATKVVSVSPGTTVEIRGVNALPTGANAPSFNLTQATMNIVSGGSDAIGATGQSHAHLGTLNLNGSTVMLAYSGQGSAYDTESFQLNGNINVTGTAASSITMGVGTNAGNTGIAIPGDATTHTITVDNVVSGVDFTIGTELENGATSTLAKAGAGTLRLADNIAHGFSGTTQVSAGTLEATGSVAGPLVVSAGATIAPGPSVGTFAAGATTLGGSYACEINGATADKLVVNGNLTLSAGSQINLSVLGGGVTASSYELISCTGSLTGSLPTITGVPAGFTVTIVSSSVVMVQAGFNPQPLITSTTAPANGTTDFNSNNGGFSVSAPVTAETDWAFSPGSWRSPGQATGFGEDNTSFLISPTYKVPQAGAVTLSFTHRYSFEANFDAGDVQVSINGAAFTHVPGTAFIQNGYTATVPGDVTHSLKNLDAFMGNSAGHPAFLTSICSVTAAAGDTVKFRFAAAYDNNTIGDLTPPGWEIDSVQVTGGVPSLMTLTWPVGVMQYSDNLEPPWTDIPLGSPLVIDALASPKRFFRLKP